MKNKSGLNFSQWEYFIRTRELRLYTEEKEKRDRIYKKLKDKFTELKQTSPSDYQKEMRRHLFGSEISIYKMRCDYLIPPQHFFQLYLKAARSENELDEFYNRSIIYFKDLIKRSKNQVVLLEEILRHPKKSQKYEKLNFSRYYSRLDEELFALKKENKSEEKLTEKDERKNLLNRYSVIKAFTNENEKSKNYIEKIIFESLQEKGYDMANISTEQLNSIISSIDIQQQIAIMEENHSDRLNGVVSYERDLESNLTRAEKKYLTEDYYKAVLADLNSGGIVEEFEGVKSKFKEEKIRNEKYFELLKKYNDRQVRKKDKADISEIEKYGDVEKFRRL